MSEKISFKYDYAEGAHPELLRALTEHNLDQQLGYGYDQYSLQAEQYIQRALGRDVPVYFVSGGTQANLLVISHLLESYESVVAADTAHIEEHETGAIESTGHKINLAPNINGKITIEDIETIRLRHIDEHMVSPKLVFISLSTELGTIYTLTELQQISAYCRTRDLYLYIDGARLAMALASSDCDWTLTDLSELADVFYIGGTKNGALFGEAIVFCTEGLDRGFAYHRKQRGALIAKGRTLGLQFRTFFEDGLYYRLGQHAVELADKIQQGLESAGVPFRYPPQTNQLFPILHQSDIESLEQRFDFHVWERYDEQSSVIRLVTSWATTTAQVYTLLSYWDEV